MAELRKGHKVNWRGAWGNEPPKEVKIKSIIKCEFPGSKDGDEVSSVKWDKVKGRNYIFDLDNGCWCWASQISEIETPT